jgi:hypothetical protein
MQSAKDSFYVALRDRLAALNQNRAVFLDGATRPAIVVSENEPLTAAAPLEQCFYLTWSAATPVSASAGARRPILELDATLEYRTSGTSEQVGVDRGRRLAELDLELAQILSPRFTAKKDYTQTPAADLGSAVLWSAPEFGPAETRERSLRRLVRVAVFFWPEVDLP